MLLLSSGTTGCETPFAGSTGINWSGTQAPGTIAVSDPKMYRREALINERNNEVAWLDQLLTDSKTIEFKPEIAREVETITALSAALGLSFDPASGLNYKRSKETGDVTQQIEVMKLQLSLDQLRRDAEVVRGKFAGQVDPVNQDVAKLGDGQSSAISSGSMPAATDQLKGAIDRLVAASAGRLDADSKGASLAIGVGVNPADLFRDRAAYRNLLKTARNAASLDELHDFGGSALLRLNFQTTVVPDRKHADIPGVVQMRIIPPVIGSDEKRRLYRGWLSYLNERINLPNGRGWRENSTLLSSGLMDNFDLVQFSYAAPLVQQATPEPVVLTGAKRGRPGGIKVPPVAMAPACSGLIVDSGAAAEPGCGILRFAVPKFLGASPEEGPYTSLTEYLDAFGVGRTTEEEELGLFARARSTLLSNPTAVVTGCALPAPGPIGSREEQLYRVLLMSRTRAAGGTVLADVDRTARRLLAARHIAAPPDDRMALIAARAARAELMLRSFERYAYGPECNDRQRTAFRTQHALLYVPPAFDDLFDRSDARVAIYDIGPREQVQQVSTVARAANSLALAVSIAASAPGSGVAGNAAGSYSRQAMGRAATLERVPAVVGYSAISQKAFGWVIGPRATVDAKGKLDLDQSLRTYDLTVDLSVPGWWPFFCLETATAWAPKPREVSEASLRAGAIREAAGTGDRRRCSTGTATDGGTSETAPASTIASLSPNDSDYAWLSSYIGRGDVEEHRRATFDDPSMEGQAVSACLPTTIMARGPSLWRTTQVVIAGTKLSATAISVAPDMSGVLVDVPALDGLVGMVAQGKLRLSLLTPYGAAEGEIDYVRGADGGCRSTERKESDGPSVSFLTPDVVVAPSKLEFTLTGLKLDQISAVTLNGQPGSLVPGKGGKTLKVNFTREQSEGLPVSRTIPLVLLKGEERQITKMVEVQANHGGQ